MDYAGGPRFESHVYQPCLPIKQRSFGETHLHNLCSTLSLGWHDMKLTIIFVNINNTSLVFVMSIIERKPFCRILSDEHEETKEDILHTPDRSGRRHTEPFDSLQKTNGNNSSYAKPSNHVTPFSKRTNKFAVQFTKSNPPSAENGKNDNEFENLDDDIIRRIQPRKRCSLVVHGSRPEPGCRFMFDRIEDRVCDYSYNQEWI